jgi:hypothetical protein
MVGHQLAEPLALEVLEVDHDSTVGGLVHEGVVLGLLLLGADGRSSNVLVVITEAGPQLEVPEGDAEGAEVAIVQALAATGPQSMRKAIVA